MSYREDYLCPECFKHVPFACGELCTEHKPKGYCVKCKKKKAVKDYSTDKKCIECRTIKPDLGKDPFQGYYY